MARFVLVTGTHFGGWSWQKVTPLLRAAGHAVWTPTLTGLGERVHLATPDVDFDTHDTDVVNLLVYEDLSDVTLVGYSYGATVIAGVAERTPERLALRSLSL
jgi:pimeloyl-ACP methyl ester carboxylesterase